MPTRINGLRGLMIQNGIHIDLSNYTLNNAIILLNTVLLNICFCGRKTNINPSRPRRSTTINLIMGALALNLRFLRAVSGHDSTKIVLSNPFFIGLVYSV